MEKTNGTMNLYNSLQLTERMKGLDRESRLILTQLPVLAIILKSCVREYEACSLQEIEAFIEASSIKIDETEVSPNRTNATIEGENVEFPALNEVLSRFDILFQSVNPILSDEKLLINLHIDMESQKDYRPGYPIEKRGIYYLARKLSAQLPLSMENSDYNALEKCYSIWICRDRIPKKEQYTITKYRMKIVDESTFTDIPAENYDLLELVLIRLGSDTYNGEKGLLDFLNILFYPHKKDFIHRLEHYIDLSSYEELKKEALKMSGLGESVLEYGIEKGRSEGWSQGRSEGLAEGADRVKDALTRLLAGESETALAKDGYTPEVLQSAKDILHLMQVNHS